MLNRILSKFGLGKKTAPVPQSDPKDMRFDVATPALESGKVNVASGKIKSALPEELKCGTAMRALPENLPTPPRAWNVTVARIELDSFWVQRQPSEPIPLPVSKGEILTLVTFDDHHQNTYECPILKIKPGTPEQVQVGPPLKMQQEQSKLSGVGSRKHYRVSCRLPAEIRTSTTTSPISCHTRDISLGGIAVDLSRTLEEDLDIELRVLSWNFPLTVQARVVRCFELDGAHVAALAFPPNLSPISKDLIGHFIVEHQRGR